MSSRRQFLSASSALAAAQVLHAGEVPARNEPISVGQIGTKHAHARGKMATFRKFPELFRVVGVVEDDREQRERMKENPAYKDLRWMDADDLLGTAGLKGVAVETDIDQLLPTAERCLQAGQHIHLDKPAGTSLPDFRRVCALADQKNLMIQMGYMFRSNPAFRFVFRAVREGWLGDVFQVHCEMSKKINDDTRGRLSRFAGGSMFELGCHLIDAVVTVLGAPQSVTPFLKNTRPDFDTLRDTCLAVFDYPQATATIRSSLCEVEGGRRRQFVVCGTRGTIVIQPLEPFRLSLTLEANAGKYRRGTHAINLPVRDGRYDGDMHQFAGVIRGEESAEYSTAHDLAVQEAVLRASGTLQ